MFKRFLRNLHRKLIPQGCF